MIMVTVCRDLEPSAGFNSKFQTAHQAARLITADVESLFSQTIGNPPRAVGLFGFPKQLLCRGFQRKLFFGNAFRFSPHRLVETAPAYLHHLTEQGDGIGLPLPPDKVVSHFDSLAKKAAFLIFLAPFADVDSLPEASLSPPVRGTPVCCGKYPFAPHRAL